MEERQRRVLLVERNPALSQLFDEALAELGFQVFAAEGRRQALDVLLEEPQVDLLLVDLVDPAAEGAALLGFLAEQRATARIPVVVMTDGEPPAGLVGRAVRLAKPFGLEELRFATEEALGGRPGPPRSAGPAREAP